MTLLRDMVNILMTAVICDAWLVQYQTYGYLSIRTASSPILLK